MKKVYDDFDKLIQSLRQQGLNDPAERLHQLLHETAWTTGSELLGELGVKIREIKKQYKNELSKETKQIIRVCLRNIYKVGPQSVWLSLLRIFGKRTIN